MGTGFFMHCARRPPRQSGPRGMDAWRDYFVCGNFSFIEERDIVATGAVLSSRVPLQCDLQRDADVVLSRTCQLTLYLERKLACSACCGAG